MFIRDGPKKVSHNDSRLCFWHTQGFKVATFITDKLPEHMVAS